MHDGKVIDDVRLAELCVRLLGERPVAVLFRAGYLSQVAGVELADGTAAVIKIRPGAARIAGCTAVQAHLARAGFPCPAPLAGPLAAGDLTVTAETLIPGGSQLPATYGAATGNRRTFAGPQSSRWPFMTGTA